MAVVVVVLAVMAMMLMMVTMLPMTTGTGVAPTMTAMTVRMMIASRSDEHVEVLHFTNREIHMPETTAKAISSSTQR